MQIRRFVSGTALALGASVLVPAFARAQIGVQRERNVPDAYAITNARIVPVSGPAIEHGTVVVRRGLIEAVGPNVTAPADAQIVDGAGLTVYPGFIDPYSDLGIPDAQPAGGRGARAAGPRQQATAADNGAPNSLHPAGLQPELQAINLLDLSPTTFDGPRSAGYTVALVAPSSGIFQGQAALIELTNDEPQRILLQSPVAMDIGFRAVRGAGYPGSLLGVFSSMRQMLYDAQHYGAEQAAHAANPRSVARPEVDASLEALQPVLARKEPVIMLASSQREIERALDVAKEFNLRPIIAGGAESDQVIARLKSEHVPVLLSLNFPRRPAASPDAQPEPLRVLRARVDAPKVAGKLAGAGVDFAFEPGGLTSWTDVLANARRTVQEGLSQDAAIRAFTLTPAQILGVSDRLGTIEPGKIANLTVIKGDLFDRNAVVNRVFVDGRPVEIPAPAPARAGRGGGAAAATAISATGTWTITITLGGQEVPATLTLQQQGQNLSGTVQGDFGTSQVSSGSCSPTGDIQFSTSGEVNGQTVEANFTGTVKGNSIQGNVNVNGMGEGSFIGTRPPTAD
jgi:imidazolonepropionase-like amidohydrolase